MAWVRLGRVYQPKGSAPWAVSHASLPTAVWLEGNRFRVFFSARDSENRSSVCWVDLNISTSIQLLSVGNSPVLTFGTAGHFDDSGVGVGSIVQSAEHDRLYYMGWNLGVRAPWRNSIGLAVGQAALPEFHRLYPGPILDRSPDDPFTLSYPWVLRLGPDDWWMWYGSNLSWGASSADMNHVIKGARSMDGIEWKRDSAPAVGFSYPGEYALARPCVIQGSKDLMMWFATRGERYRIGAARSVDGVKWMRCDQDAGLAPQGDGWEAEMVCYPCVFRHRETLYMLYNGNQYGRDGFGIAAWEGPEL